MCRIILRKEIRLTVHDIRREAGHLLNEICWVNVTRHNLKSFLIVQRPTHTLQALQTDDEMYMLKSMFQVWKQSKLRSKWSRQFPPKPELETLGEGVLMWLMSFDVARPFRISLKMGKQIFHQLANLRDRIDFQWTKISAAIPIFLILWKLVLGLHLAPLSVRDRKFLVQAYHNSWWMHLNFYQILANFIIRYIENIKKIQ